MAKIVVLTGNIGNIIKSKVVPAQRHEDVGGSGCIDPCFLDLGIRWR
jgi:hypothetical protein